MIYENKFPGSIGFINDEVEVFVVKENIFARFFNPHFYLYNHKTKCVQKIEFKDVDSIVENKELIDFLNTVRKYSLNRDRYIFSRTYYDDLVAEWEINNKKRIGRRYLQI